MSIKIKTICFSLFTLLVLLSSVDNASALFGGKELVTINGVEFTPEDYRHWWREWREPGMNLQESPDEFIDWMLLAQEARDMQLQDSPSYRKKLEVFLKVRALMQLKGEEVDARKTIPTRDELWQLYKEGYTPILNLRMLAVTDEEQAQEIKKYMDQGTPLDQVVETAGLQGVVEQMEATGPMRYTRIPESLQPLAMSLKPGEAGGPASFGHSWYFIEVLDRGEGNEADFEIIKQKLIRDSLKQQEYELTYQLLEKLKADYNVQVNDEVIAAIQPDGIDDELKSKQAVIIGKTEVPAGFIYEAVVKSRKKRSHSTKSAENFEDAKQRIVNDLLVQTLTGMEALARRYEEEPPLKHTFQFYSQHRLIKELEALVIQPQVEVSDADIEAYYRQHQDKYSRQGMVELAVVKTNELKLARQLEKRIKSGEDFFKVMEPISPAGIQIEKTPLAHLQPVVQAEVRKLSAGQVSAGVKDGDNLLFIKLVRKGEPEVAPLEKVKGQIKNQLQADRFQEQRAGLVKQLRDRSTIKLNRSVWKKLNQELHEEETGNES